jgi:hypothetical protein
MPLWSDHFAENACEVAAAGNQFYNFVTGFDPCELHRLGWFAIRIPLRVFGGPARIGHSGTDIGRDLRCSLAADRSEQGGGGTTSDQDSITEHGLFFL